MLHGIAQSVRIGDGQGASGRGNHNLGLLFLGSFALNDIDDHTSLLELNLTIVVHHGAPDGDGIADLQVLGALSLDTEAGNGDIIVAVNDHDNGDVAVVIAPGGLDLGDDAGQGSGIVQGAALPQGLDSLQDLPGILGLLGCVEINVGIQGTAGIELDGALVVGNGAGDGDHIVDAQILNALALQAEHLDASVAAFDLHGNGDVAVLLAVAGVERMDLTGQSNVVRQGLTGLQLVSQFHDLSGIGGDLHAALTLDDLVQGAACVELDGALVILQGTGDGDGVTDGDGIGTLALQTVALNGSVLAAGNSDGNGNVLVVSAVGGIDLGDHTGQGGGVGQGLAILQRIGQIQDGGHVLTQRCGQLVGPGQGLLGAVGAGQSCGQDVGNFLCALFIDVDDDFAVAIVDDLDKFFGNVNAPLDIVLGSANGDRSNTLKVGGSCLGDVLVDVLQVCGCICDVLIGSNNRCVGGVGSLGFAGSCVVGTSCEACDQHCHQQEAGN